MPTRIQLWPGAAPTIYWVKSNPFTGGHYTPLAGDRLNELTELVFMLYKGDRMPPLNRSKRAKWHQDGFPLQLPVNCLKLVPWAQCVLDPFCESGTVALAAARLGRQSFIGIDYNQSYLDQTLERLRVELEPGQWTQGESQCG